MKRKLIKCLLFCFCGLATITFWGCTINDQGQTAKYRESKSLMGTIVQVDVCREGLEQNKIDLAYQDLWKRLEDISWRMYVLNEKSDIAKINKSFSKPVQVKADTYQLIRDAIYFSTLTNGAFDITVWPLIELWNSSVKQQRHPTQDMIDKILPSIGSEHIHLLENHQVSLTHPGTKIDVGGIAKGYAVDEAARILQRHDIRNFLIDAGGDMYAGGKNCQKQPWRVGIRDPRDKSKIISVVALSDAALTTSGNYEKIFAIELQRWSHILDPRTGYPQKNITSATVIAPTATEADALSTALCVLDIKEGTLLMSSLDDKYASLIVVMNEQHEITSYDSKYFKKYRIKIR